MVKVSWVRAIVNPRFKARQVYIEVGDPSLNLPRDTFEFAWSDY